MIEGFLLWVEAFILQYGLSGTFIIALLESFIFPIPTAAIIAPATGFGLDPLMVTIVATIGSVIGAVIGYALGFYLGHPVAERLFKKHIPRVEKWFDKYGAWAILIAAFTPVPFKVFTWCGGIFRMDFKKFIIASIIGRFAQFALFAYAGSFLGPSVLVMLGF
jgi:membrane protein YqaA with SNARE-associated domain